MTQHALTDSSRIDAISAELGYFEDASLKNIAKKCSRLIINENFGTICSETFIEPNLEELEVMILDLLQQQFEDRVGRAIADSMPQLEECEIDAQLDRLSIHYRQEFQEQIRSTTHAALKELKTRIKGLHKEIKALKRKYTL